MVNVEIISQDWCSWTNAIGEVLCQSMPRIQLLLSFKLVSTTLSFESRHFPRSHFQDFLFLQDEEYSVKLSQVSLIHVQYIGLWQYCSDSSEIPQSILKTFSRRVLQALETKLAPSLLVALCPCPCLLIPPINRSKVSKTALRCSL